MNKHLEKRRDELAEAAQVEDFKGNPNGYHVAPFVNADTVTDAFADGFDACYAEMAPLIEALKWYSEGHEYIADKAREALKKIGVTE